MWLIVSYKVEVPNDISHNLIGSFLKIFPPKNGKFLNYTKDVMPEASHNGGS